MNNQAFYSHPFGSLMFYQRDFRVARVQGSSACRLLRSPDHLLAQFSRDADAARTAILATDVNLSVVGAEWAAPLEQFTYLPYGFDSSEGQFLSPPGFNGEMRQNLTGHYLLGDYRAYCPTLMRFNSPDSWSPFGDGGLNPYAYVENDPINHTDSTGHMPQLRRASSPDLPALVAESAKLQLPASTRLRRPSLPTIHASVRSRLSGASQSSSRRESMFSLGTASSYGSSNSLSSVTSMASGDSVGLSGASERHGKNVMGYLRAIKNLDIYSDGWGISKKQAFFTKPLTPTEQFKFDIFQNAVFHYQVPAPFAAGLMGSANHKQLGTSGIWQVRLSKGGRMTYVLNEKVVMVRDVGGHT